MFFFYFFTYLLVKLKNSSKVYFLIVFKKKLRMNWISNHEKIANGWIRFLLNESKF